VAGQAMPTDLGESPTNVATQNVDIEKTSEQDETCKLEKQVFNIPVTAVALPKSTSTCAENSSCPKTENSIKCEAVEVPKMSINTQSQLLVAQNFPNLVLQPSTRVDLPNPRTSESTKLDFGGQINKSLNHSLPGQCTPRTPIISSFPNIGYPGQLIQVSKAGFSAQLSATPHPGLPRIVSTVSEHRLPGHISRITHTGQPPSTAPVSGLHGQIFKVINRVSEHKPSMDIPGSALHTAPSPISVETRPGLRLAPISSLSNQPSPKKAPPSMPPLLRLPSAPPVFSIPVSSSGPSNSMIHETPIQSAYANIPVLALNSQVSPNSSAIVELLQNSKHYIPQSPPAGSSADAFPCSLTGNSEASYMITLPGGSQATISYPLTLPSGGSGSADDTVVLSDNSSGSSGDSNKDPNNAAKCKEYRERSRAKKEQEIKDFQYHLSKNIRLKANYDKKTDTIKKLKAYYLKCLKNKRFKCIDNKMETSTLLSASTIHGTSTSVHALTSNRINTSIRASTLPGISIPLPVPTLPSPSSTGNGYEKSTPLPMVTIKAEETELLITNVKSELDIEDDPML